MLSEPGTYAVHNRHPPFFVKAERTTEQRDLGGRRGQAVTDQSDAPEANPPKPGQIQGGAGRFKQSGIDGGGRVGRCLPDHVDAVRIFQVDRNTPTGKPYLPKPDSGRLHQRIQGVFDGFRFIRVPGERMNQPDYRRSFIPHPNRRGIYSANSIPNESGPGSERNFQLGKL
jgi:hypothetical protein